jgi:hypothetical protein
MNGGRKDIMYAKAQEDEILSRERMVRLLTILATDPALLPSFTEFGWTASLEADERKLMQHEFAQAVAAALQSGDWTAILHLEYDWRATAEVASDPALMARLLAPRDPTQEVPLKRP